MKGFKLIYYTFIIGLAIVVLALIFPVLPVPNNYQIMVVKSGSMEPTIKMGGLVFVKPAADYQAGDIITFKNPDSLNQAITHRIFEVKRQGDGFIYITKGDANNTPDQGQVLPADIIGRVMFSLPYLGYAVQTAKQPYGFLFLIIIPALIIVVDEFKKIIQEATKIRRKKNRIKQQALKIAKKKIIRIVVLIIFNFSLFGADDTQAFLSDREVARNNIIQIGIWDDQPEVEPRVTVIYPNGGEVWTIVPPSASALVCQYLGMNSQCQYPIRWQTQGLANSAWVDIWYCNQSGSNCFYQVANQISNTGVYWWQLPYDGVFIGSDIRIKIVAYDNQHSVEDMSDQDYCPPILTEEDINRLLAEIALADEMGQPEAALEPSSSTDSLLDEEKEVEDRVVIVQPADQTVIERELINDDIKRSNAASTIDQQVITESIIEPEHGDFLPEQVIDIDIVAQPMVSQTDGLPLSDPVSDKETLREIEVIISKNDAEEMISVTHDNDLPEPDDPVIKTFDSASSGN